MNTPNIFKSLLSRAIYFQKIYILQWNRNLFVSYKLPPEDIQITPATLDHLRTIHSDPDFDLSVYSWDVLKDKFTKGSWKFISATLNDEVVGYGIRSIAEMSIFGSKAVDFLLPRGAVYLSRHFVLKKARGKGIHKMLIAAGLQQVWIEDFEEVYTAVNCKNRVSFNNCITLGARNIGSVNFVKTNYFNIFYRSTNLILSDLRLGAAAGN